MTSVGAIVTKDDVLISYLPLAHCFERVVEAMVVLNGASIGFYRGDVLLLVEDIQALRPTIFPTVPRLLNRIYDRLRARTVDAPGIVGVISRYAVATKLQAMHAGLGNTHPVWDRILFQKVRDMLGGRLNRVITGSAPISKQVLDFIRITFCCTVHEGRLSRRSW